MDKQERNKAFLAAVEEVLQKEDGRFIACMARSAEGKTLIVMDFGNDVGHVYEALKAFAESMEKMATGEIGPEDRKPYGI